MKTVPPPAGPADGDGPRRWAVVVGTIGGLFLGVVFFVAVWGVPPIRLGKVGDPEAFAQVLQLERLVVVLSPFEAAVFAIGVEAAVAFFLLLGIRRLWVLVPVTLVVVFFMYLNGRAYLAWIQGEKLPEMSCGCFGNLVDRSPAEAFWQDAALLLPALLMAYVGRPRGEGASAPPVRTALAGLLTMGTVFFAAAAPEMRLDDLSTRLRPGTDLRTVCAGTGPEHLCLAGEALAPGLTEGEHVVVLADLTDPDFQAEVAHRSQELLDFAAREDAPDILVLFSGPKEQATAFQFQALAPPFQYQDVPAALLRPLHRRLPRTFVVRDGVVRATYSGLPPMADLDL